MCFLPITLRNTQTGTAYEYFAFNLIGLVEAVDTSRSKVSSFEGDFFGDTQIHDLVIDDSLIHGLLMFRLKEDFSTIIVHKSVKESIERRKIPTVKFVRPEDYVAL